MKTRPTFKNRSTHLGLFVALLLGGSLAYGQEPAGVKKARTPADYEVRTLRELAEKGAEADSRSDKAETRVVYSNILPSRVSVTYTGATRALPQLKQDVLHQWARLYAGSMESYTTPYQTEMLFQERGRTYWLAIRKDLLSRFRQDLKKGKGLDLFLIRLGAARLADNWEPVLLVESFETEQSTLPRLAPRQKPAR
jgi:hypothetical protein